MRKGLLTIGWAMVAMVASAQDEDSLKTQSLEGVTVSVRRQGMVRMKGAMNGITIGKEELFRAACCNLGESFTTNPSVDVSYSDATTGAKQIKLLGLSSTYVQMLTENIPNFRGVAAPYALDYVPGSWMHSIQVSKGASSVKNGYESITGQIDIEYLKPDDDEGVTVNVYGNSLGRLEANADGNIHIDEHFSTEVLLHYQDDFGHHDINDDGFLDQPNVRQWNLQNRWKWRGDRYIFHGGLALVNEKREGGQQGHHAHVPKYIIGVDNKRYEGYMKHAFILDADHGTNIALMGNVSLHQTDAQYGMKEYNLNEKNAYAQLMFESDLTPQHNLSAGISLNHDYLGRDDKETTLGIYAQYTLNLNDQIMAMAGVRADHSSRFGTFVTPRLHVKYTPADIVSLRASVGKGYRTVHAMAENHYLLASGRILVIDDLQQEEAWNYGASASWYIPLFNKTLRLNLEYYHTHFIQQAIVDYDSDPTLIHIANLNGRSYSNTFQVDASYPFFEGFELTASYRLNDVKTTFDGKLMEKPLTSRYKGLITMSYKTPLGLWQFDATLQLNGGGRIPTVADGLWAERFPAYEQLSLQATRWFRHFSIYVGGENLTGYRQKQTIINAHDPWSSTFDPTLVWGPVHGAMFYMGIRMNFGNKL